MVKLNTNAIIKTVTKAATKSAEKVAKLVEKIKPKSDVHIQTSKVKKPYIKPSTGKFKYKLGHDSATGFKDTFKEGSVNEYGEVWAPTGDMHRGIPLGDGSYIYHRKFGWMPRKSEEVEAKVLEAKNPDEVVATIDPLYKIKLFTSPDGRVDHYMIDDAGGGIFDHFNNKWVDDASQLGKSNSDALLVYKYGEAQNPWFGNMLAIRDRLLRRGYSRAGNRTATIGEDGALHIEETAPKNIMGKSEPNPYEYEASYFRGKQEPNPYEHEASYMQDAEQANIFELMELEDAARRYQLQQDFYNILAAAPIAIGTAATAAALSDNKKKYYNGGRMNAWKISFKFRNGGKFL